VETLSSRDGLPDKRVVGFTTRAVVVRAVAASLIPLCVATVIIVPVGTADARFYNVNGFVTLGAALGVMVIGPVAGFAAIVPAFRGRRLRLAGLAALYFPLWWSFLLLYWFVLSVRLVYYWCTDPRPGACWP
jgi:hypothetical protein